MPEQLPAAAQAAVTRAAVALAKAARAGVDADTYTTLVAAQMTSLHRAWNGRGVGSVQLLGALIAAQARITAHLADLADRAAGDGEAGRYLDQLGELAAHERE